MICKDSLSKDSVRLQSRDMNVEEDEEWGRELPNGSFTGQIGLCQRNVWVALVIAIGISLVMGLFITKLAANVERTPTFSQPPAEIRTSWITKVMWTESRGSLTERPSVRVYILSWLLAGLIIQLAYSCVLISLLTIPRVPIPVNSLQDLRSQDKIPYLIEVGTLIHDTFQKAESGLYKDILEKAYIIDDFGANRQWVMKQKMASLIPIISMKKAMSEYFSQTARCFYYIAREPIIAVPFALAFPKGSKLAPLFNKCLDAQTESGIIDQRVARETANATACLVTPDKERGEVLRPLSLMDLAGLFLIHAIGTGISFVIFTTECLLQRI
ncbi:glutamate receptor 4-like [Macrobrachium nipponense]|uniref:glutamate receptor 4-like n=1 Tax=Macrobrachium nipponense TaxID=159736 RepID=UPI0030C84832